MSVLERCFRCSRAYSRCRCYEKRMHARLEAKEEKSQGWQWLRVLDDGFQDDTLMFTAVVSILVTAGIGLGGILISICR